MISIVTDHLTKKFDKPVLRDISLSIPGNCIYGLIGNNGSGKTTLINCLLGLVLPTSGTVLINGLKMKEHKAEIRKSIGVVLSEDYLIHELTGQQFLEFTGRLYRVNPGDLKTRITDIGRIFFEKGDILSKNVAGYSTGMKRKLGFCAAVIHKPNILILDEPFAGLDPSSCQKLIQFLKLYISKSRIIFLTSHNLNYLEQFITHAGIIQDGRITSSEPIIEITRYPERTLEKTLNDPSGYDYQNFSELTWIRS